MHIEPGLVNGAKIALSYATAAGAAGIGVKFALEALRERGLPSFVARTAIASLATLISFQLLPHAPVGVSEVHFIFGSTLFLLFGAAPAALGLALGLLAQGLLFAQIDLPQYGMNVTTLLVPLFAIKLVADRIIPRGTAYADVSYKQALALSTTYQAGVVAWVGFWVTYGQGLAITPEVMTFGAAYLMVIAIEPLVDLAVLAGAKTIKGLEHSGLVSDRTLKAA
ncbi:energy-coupling factor ABC transporter permease [Celeribacter arenosi]|uniref:energy-coupling factor ABC transporter permease n=1 Tax=Celeribacter arenosi TaxID=792649 RepID=UPI0031D97813